MCDLGSDRLPCGPFTSGKVTNGGGMPRLIETSRASAMSRGKSTCAPPATAMDASISWAAKTRTSEYWSNSKPMTSPRKRFWDATGRSRTGARVSIGSTWMSCWRNLRWTSGSFDICGNGRKPAEGQALLAAFTVSSKKARSASNSWSCDCVGCKIKNSFQIGWPTSRTRGWLRVLATSAWRFATRLCRSRISWFKSPMRNNAVCTYSEAASAIKVTNIAISMPVATTTIVDVCRGRKLNSVKRRRPTWCPTRSPTYAIKPATNMMKTTVSAPCSTPMRYAAARRNRKTPIVRNKRFGIQAAMNANQLPASATLRKTVAIT